MSVKKPEPDLDETAIPKERPCLMCRTKFLSLWSGERICNRCKTSGVWRAGIQWTSGRNAS
ncbi:MAG: hypothetical protein EXQ94_02035 [Alphaproteobacteria bacterium]|nr:hypothetical protein [Alphaproteobacteria bacterium]